MGAALPFLTVAAVGMQALGSIAQGNAAAKSANYNAAIASNNAQIATNNATLAAQQGAANAGIEQQKTRATVGAIKAAQAANGVDVNKGSAVDVRSSAAELGELNAITIRSNAARSAYGYQTQAASDQAQAQLDRQQGKYAKQAGYVKAGTSILGDAAMAGGAGNFDSWLNSTSMNSVTTGPGAVTEGIGGLY